MLQKKVNVLQFICPAGFYGAERWVLALANNSVDEHARQDLAVTIEPNQGGLEIMKFPHFFSGECHQIDTASRFDWRAIRRLCKIIRDRDIHVIHTHGYKSDIIGVIAARLTGIKSISTPHGFGKTQSKKMKLFIKLGCFSFRFFDYVVPLSSELKQEVIRRGAPVKKIEYIQNGVDLKEVDETRLLENIASDKSGKRIGYIGQLIPGKQVDHIIKVFERLWKKDSSLELELIGDGASRVDLEQLAKECESKGSIHFLGFRNDRLKKLKQFDLFCMTSSSEGIPRCLMESMGMGVPIAAYDIQGVDQLIKHEETGLLATLNNMDELESCWSRLIYDDQLSSDISKRALDFVQKKFSAARLAEEYLVLYRRVLGWS